MTKKAGDLLQAETLLAEKEFECHKHGKYTGRVTKYFGVELNPMCPVCDKELEKLRELATEQEIEIIRLENLEQKERFLTKLNIGKKFWNESFETFDAYTADLEKHLNTCKVFANDCQGRMLLMLGKNGNGKNHLAASILKHTGGYMYSVFEIELLLKECYSGRSSESELYRKFCDIPLLVINEIGRHKVGDWEMNFLSYIINKRYENLMPTILISNAHLKENCPENGCSGCFQNLLGNDVLSRIIETSEILIFNEEDYRYKKREARGENYGT